MTAAEPAGIERAPKLDAANPWPGLAPYDEASQSFFQGRDAEAEALLDLVASYPVVALYSKSGLGKSSLLKAGLFPRLREQGFLPVYARLDFTANAASPWQQLLQLLRTAAEDARLECPEPRPGEGLWEFLHRRDFEIWSGDNHLRPPVFVLDQFEEIFSRRGADIDVRAIFQGLGDLLENRLPPAIASDPKSAAELDLFRQRYRVVVSFREDYLPELRTWESRLPSLLRNSLRLMPMSRENAIDAIERAGAAVLAPGVAVSIVDFVSGDVSQEGMAGVEPVMLSLCCTQLNRRRPEGGLIDAKLVQSAGPNIIEDFYSDAMEGMPEGVHRFVEDFLIQGERTRGSYARDEAIKQGLLDEAQLQQLTTTHRLLRVDSQGNVPRIELIHDRLVDVVRRARDARRARLDLEKARERENHRRQRRHKVLLVSALLVVSGFASTLFWSLRATRQSEQEARQATAQVRQEKDRADAARDAAVSSAKSASAAAAVAQARLRQVSLLATYGWAGASDPWLYENAVKADDAIQKMIQSATDADVKRRSGVTMQIWAKDIDQDRIRLALSNLGFRMEKRGALLRETATNAVWFGTPVETQDVKLVALALMRAGIEVRSIRPIQDHIPTRDSSLIQAGSAMDAAAWPRLTADQVVRALRFTRQSPPNMLVMGT